MKAECAGKFTDLSQKGGDRQGREGEDSHRLD